jgi:5,10-methylene-tetrahydrofolate dehydrogenase/methenyl tetrahydrofolate cyclohydrolase
MKSIPVTPELLYILENAEIDSHSFITECEEDVDKYEANAKLLLLAGIERRKQLLAVIKDLLERYTD